MFLNLFKKNNVEIYAPVNGEVISITDVPDPVFSEKMMGEGIAIMPENGGIHAPVDGEIIQIAPTKHAVGIRAKDGSEILIHVGLETVSLKGEGFKVAVKAGDMVQKGQLLLEVDWEYIAAHAKSTVTPIVITNSNEGNKQFSFTDNKKSIQGETVLITVS